jgi:CubicO group peptidase (beta-lactamase class C family)
LRGASYDDALRDQILKCIGAGRATTFAEAAVFHRTATGHVRGEDGRQVLAPPIRLPRSLGPAGFTLHCSVEDLIAFARAHIDGGSLVSPEAAAEMRKPAIGLPDGTSWGLGWKIIPSADGDFVGHDGGTIGQSASLWMSPKHGLAVAMCCNGGRGGLAWERIAYPIFREVCGDVPRAKPQAHAPAPRALNLYEGRYDNAGVAVRIRAEADHLVVDVEQKQLSQPAMSFALHSIGSDRFRTTLGDDDNVVMAFMEPDANGVPQLFYAGRLHRRREESR